MSANTIPSIIEIGHFASTCPIDDYSDFNSWGDWDFVDDFNPSDNFDQMDPEVLSTFIHHIRSQLIIEYSGESYVGGGVTVYTYTFSYCC